MKKEVVKNKLLVILGGLLFLSVVGNVWQWKNFAYYKKGEDEFLKGAKIDNQLIIKQADTLVACYNMFDTQKKISVASLKDYGNDVLTNLLEDLKIKSKTYNDTFAELEQIGLERHQIFSKFKYVKINQE